MFDSFEESLLENLVENQPEPQLIFRIPQSRKKFDKIIEGRLYFVLECKHTKTSDAMREILHIRFTPLAWFEEEDDAIYPWHVWYNEHRTKGWFNSFQLCVDHYEKIVRFGPSGNLLISAEDLRGLGIGTYAWRILINWAQRKFPHYNVHPIYIAEIDATGDNLERRNHFFIKHGFKPFYKDETKMEGWFRCERVSELKPSVFIPAWKNKNPIETITDLLKENEELERKIKVMTQNMSDWFNYFDIVSARLKKFKIITATLTLGCLILLGIILF